MALRGALLGQIEEEGDIVALDRLAGIFGIVGFGEGLAPVCLPSE
jgi:hypothetical protein